MTNESDPPQGPSPQLFFETINAYQRTAALKAAIELDLFTAVNDGNHTVESLSRWCQASNRGIRMLADYLTILGFMTKDGNRYDLTQNTKVFLNKRSPAYLGSTIRFLQSPHFVDGFKDLTGAVRKGGTVFGAKGTLDPEHPAWIDFAHAMVPMMAGPAQWIGEKVAKMERPIRKVLDIAAGHGLFGIEIAKRLPEAEVVALDWKSVLRVAKAGAEKAGIGNRYRTLVGSAFEVDFGKGYDLVLVTNFLHHFDPSTCEALLRKIHGALNVHGKAVTLEFVPNEDRISPPQAADFAIMMLATTPSGDAYTFTELDRMFLKAGFSRSELHELPMSAEDVIISYK